MKRRDFFKLSLLAAPVPALLSTSVYAEGSDHLRGTGDLGAVIERASGSLQIVDTTNKKSLGKVEGLGDLSHASIVYSRDERYAYVFGRDGGLTKVDMLLKKIDKRVIQGGNSIGGAISDDGELIAVSNYKPGGVKVFDSRTLETIAEIPAIYGNNERSKTVGLVDAPGRKFVFTLYNGGEIWVADFSDKAKPEIQKFKDIGDLPYDALITSDGRHYIAGLYGEDGLTHLDLWQKTIKPQRILDGYGRGEEKLPVYKMPHLEGWAKAGGSFLLPAIGRHEVLVLNESTFKESGRIKVHGQPVFVMARPDGRQAWVNFAHPRNDTIQVIDTMGQKVVHTFKPGPAALHMEFSPRGHEVWISIRDADRVDIYDTRTFKKKAEIAALKPSGIFFTARAHKIGL